jgi:hypothetical protein
MGILDSKENLRQRAKQHLACGAVTDEYDADRVEVRF